MIRKINLTLLIVAALFTAGLFSATARTAEAKGMGRPTYPANGCPPVRENSLYPCPKNRQTRLVTIGQNCFKSGPYGGGLFTPTWFGCCTYRRQKRVCALDNYTHGHISVVVKFGEIG